MPSSFPYAPPANGKYNDEFFERISNTEPPLKLSTMLMPSSRPGASRPPKVHYGYILQDDFVQSYAEKYRLIHLETSMTQDPETGEPMKETEEDIEATLQAVLEHLFEELGITTYTPCLACVFGSSSLELLVSFITNYTFPKYVDFVAIKKVKERLGCTDEARWYLDAREYKWSKGLSR